MLSVWCDAGHSQELHDAIAGLRSVEAATCDGYLYEVDGRPWRNNGSRRTYHAACACECHGT